VFENRVLRRIFGPKRDEETGGCRKLHNEELHNLCSSPSVIKMIKSRRIRLAGHVARMGEKGIIGMIKSRRMRWAGQVARMGEKRNAYRILVEKPEGRRPLGRPKCRCVGNIKIDLGDRMGWCGFD
jgi:hypothetical protein